MIGQVPSGPSGVQDMIRVKLTENDNADLTNKCRLQMESTINGVLSKRCDLMEALLLHAVLSTGRRPDQLRLVERQTPDGWHWHFEVDDAPRDLANVKQHVKPRKLKCSDIPDQLMYDTIRKCIRQEAGPAFLWDVQKELSQFPPKVVQAKLKKMVAAKKIAGCGCGCRGDFYC